MNISRDEALRVAELANLELTEAEIATYGGQLGSILSYCQKLNELDTTNVEPMAGVEAGGFRSDARKGETQEADPVESQHARADLPRDAGIIRDVIRRAPEAVEAPTPYFRVPKVIDR